MEQPVEQPCYKCDFRFCARGKKKKKNALYKYSNNENIPYQFYSYIKNIKMLIKVYITALKRFRISSNLFNSQFDIQFKFYGSSISVVLEFLLYQNCTGKGLHKI